MKFKLIALVFVVCMVSLVLFLPFVSAVATGLVDLGVSGGPIKTTIGENLGNMPAAIAQTFKPNTVDPEPLYNCGFWLKKSETPTGNLVAFLTEVTSNHPTPASYAQYYAQALSISITNVTVEGVGDSDWVYTQWNFSGDYSMEMDVQYAISVVAVGFEGSATDYVNFNVAENADYALGQYSSLENGWVTSATYDFCFLINGYSPPSEPTPTPSPSPSPSGTPVEEYPPVDPFVPVPSYYMVLLVLFACVAVLAGLYVTFEREGENKGVALLFVLVGLVLFVILIVGYLVGF